MKTNLTAEGLYDALLLGGLISTDRTGEFRAAVQSFLDARPPSRWGESKVKITDKMRLDWLNRKRVKFIKGFSRPGVDWILEVQGREGWPLRRAIDAAIRAGERNKI